MGDAFKNNIIKVVSVQLIFQLCFALLLHYFPPEVNVEVIQMFNISAYFFICVLLLVSRRYTLANRDIVDILTFIFIYLVFSSLVMVFIYHESFNEKFTTYLFYSILFPAISSFFTNYLFFYALWPKDKVIKIIGASTLVTIFIVLTVFYHVPFFSDFLKRGEDFYMAINFNVQVSVYYVYIFNLMFLLFFWLNYFQEQFALSEYLPAILSVYLLMIVNEIYQIYNLMHNLQNYIGAQYFNAIVNIGFILLWLIRLHYLTGPKRDEGEKYILDYEFLRGYQKKPSASLIEKGLLKLGKIRLFAFSVLIFMVISIPLMVLGDVSYANRINILLMLIFLMGVLIVGVYGTQYRWYRRNGFLIKPKKK